MSTPADYVASLRSNGIKLWVDNGQLRYHAKRGALSSEELARLRSMKGEIVAELMQATTSPLSFQQQWLLNLIEEHPDWRATLSHTFRLNGSLDCAALERAFTDVLRMHASLRTRMVRFGNEWRQQIEAVDRFALPGTPAQSVQLDPSVAPLIKAHLIRISAQEHLLVLSIHRLATDCLGLSQVLADLWSRYAARAQDAAVPNMEESTRYRDYVHWQHTTDGAWQQKHAPYWEDYLARTESARWPLSGWGPPEGRDGPGLLTTLESSFGEALSARLRELGRRTQALPALVTLTAYVACLSRRTGQRDFVVPFQVAGRTAAHERTVGCFAHVVYLRMRVQGSESFLELLKLVSNEFYRAVAFRQDCGRMALRRPDLLRGILCQWLSWHPADFAEPQGDNPRHPLDLEVEKVRCLSPEELSNVPPATVDLEINFFDAKGDISALAIYRTDRFPKDAVAQLLRELRSVAEQAVQDSGVCLSLSG